MQKALAAAPRAAKSTPAPRYEDTNAYLRGRVLARLRELSDPDGVNLMELARQLGGDGAAGLERDRLEKIVESLERDGLARVRETPERGGAHAAGAEERAPYAAKADQERPREVRVSLP